MRYKTIVAASAAAAAAAIPCAAAAASTPDWLTLASLETGSPSPLPVVCGEEPTGTFIDPACAGIFGTGQYDDEAFGVPLPRPPQVPQSPQTYDGLPALANVDASGALNWSVCGVAVLAEELAFDC